jgi:hypothetical protein
MRMSLKLRWLVGVCAVAVSVASLVVAITVLTLPKRPTSAPGFEIRPVLCIAPSFSRLQTNSTGTTRTVKSLMCQEQYLVTNAMINAHLYNTSASKNSPIPADPEFRHVYDTSAKASALNGNVLFSEMSGRGHTDRYILGPTRLTNSSVESARIKSLPNLKSEFVLQVTMTASGLVVLNSFASQHFGEEIAIVYRNYVVGVERVQGGPPAKFLPFRRTISLIPGVSRARGIAIASYLNRGS